MNFEIFFNTSDVIEVDDGETDDAPFSVFRK